MVDAPGLGPDAFTGVPVRVRPRAPEHLKERSSDMAVNVETLEKLERRITLTVAAADISSEVESRLKRLARTVKADGFRPGKVPMSVVA